MAKARSKKFKITRDVLITILVIVLILAIVMTSIYFINRDLFNQIVSIFLPTENTTPDGGGANPGGGSDNGTGGETGGDTNNLTNIVVQDGIISFPAKDPIYSDGGVIPANAPVGRLEVHFIDIGQGDSILIRFPDGQAMLIDAGGSYSSKANHPYKARGVRQKIFDYIDSFGIKTLSAVLLTHSDSDHSAYLDNVLERYEVKNIFLPDYDGALDGYDGRDKDRNGNPKEVVPGKIPTGTCGEVYVAALAEKYTATDGKVYNANIIRNLDEVVNIMGENYSMKSYCRDAAFYDEVKNGDAHMLNGVSPVTVLEYENRTIMFMGDGEGEGDSGKNNVDQWFIAKNIKYDIDVLKVGHHGSAPSTSQELLDYVDPEYAVISCGLYNKHKHPRQECIDRLGAYRDVTPDSDANGIQRIYRTDQDGNIVLTIEEGGAMNFTTNKDKAEVKTRITAITREYLYYNKQSYACVA